MGPMRAARRFAVELETAGVLDRVAELRVELYGSLALTGLGHGTDRAVLLGLSGEEAATIDPASIEPKLVEIRSLGRLAILGSHAIPFHEADDLVFHRDQMIPPGAVTQHPNGVRLSAFDGAGNVLMTGTYFSIGGGFILADGEDEAPKGVPTGVAMPYPFSSAAESAAHGRGAGRTDLEGDAGK